MPFLPRRPPLSYVCPSCLRQLRTLPRRQRKFSSNAARLHTSNPPLPPPSKAAYAHLKTRRLISLSGHDAAQFLQGLTTVKITKRLQQEGGPGFYSAFLNAAGRVLYDVFIYPTAGSRAWKEWKGAAEDKLGEDDGFLIEVDAAEIELLAKHLRRFKLRAKVGIRIVDQEEWTVWARWGETSPLSKENISDTIGCEDQRAPSMGRRLILRGGHHHRQSKDTEAFFAGLGTGGSEEVTHASYDVHRMLLGVPEGQTEIVKEAALPQESDIDYMGGIDFRKGCYVGQELTIRTHHTGVVRKRILPVQLYEGSAPPQQLSYDPDYESPLPPRGTNITWADKTRKGRSAGRFIAGVGNVGLALCRLEVMTSPNTNANTNTNGASTATAMEGDEFKIAWASSSPSLSPSAASQGNAEHTGEIGEGEREKEVKIKAFTPSWHHERAEAQRVQRI